MKVFLATDHAGLALKEKIKTYLIDNGYETKDFGAHKFDEDDDYPDFIGKVAEAVSKDPKSFGIILGGSGQGEAIAANKFKSVRASLFYGPAVPIQAADITGRRSSNSFEIIRLNREHDDANILSLGARFLKEKDALKAVKIFLETPFPGEERHVRRIKKIEEIEEMCGCNCSC